MSNETKIGARLIPCLAYRDAHAAIAWLCEAFGFSVRAQYDDGNGGIAHAELVCGDVMIMLGSVNDGPYGRHVLPPGETGGINSQGPYWVVEDCDAHYARAMAAGAVVVIDIKDESYGGRGYTCRDPEGHLWSFGTYDPWDAQPDL